MTCSEFVFRCYAEGLPGAIEMSARAPGVLRFGDREVPAGAGGGIQRGSALYRFLERQGGRILEKEPEPSLFRQPAAAFAVEERIEAYFSDLQHRKPKAARIDLASPELEPSFERFASSLHRARRCPGNSTVSRTAVLGNLFDAAADFVTPGDLQRSRSLAFCGKLKTKE